MTSLLQIAALTLVLVGGSAVGRWIGSRVGLSAMNASLLVCCLWGLLGMGIDNRVAWGRIGSWAWLQPGLDNAAQIAILVSLFDAGLLGGGPEKKDVPKARQALGIAAAGLAVVAGAMVATHFKHPSLESLFIAAAAVPGSLVLSHEDSTASTVRAAAVGKVTQWTAALVVGFVTFLLILRVTAGPFRVQAGTIRLLLTAKVLVFLLVAWFLGSRYTKSMAENTDSSATPRLLLGFILMSALIYTYAALFLTQLIAFTWAYLCGFLFAKTHFRQSVARGRRWLAYLICLPVLFLSAGLRADRTVLDSRLFLALGAAWGVKALGGILGARLEGSSRLDSAWAGLSTIPQAETGLILAGFGLARGLIGPSGFSVLALGAIGTTLLAPVLAAARRLSTSTLQAGKTLELDAELQ